MGLRLCPKLPLLIYLPILWLIFRAYFCLHSLLAIISHSFFHLVGVDPNQKYDQLFLCPNDSFVQDSVVLSMAITPFHLQGHDCFKLSWHE